MQEGLRTLNGGDAREKLKKGFGGKKWQRNARNNARNLSIRTARAL